MVGAIGANTRMIMVTLIAITHPRLETGRLECAALTVEATGVKFNAAHWMDKFLVCQPEFILKPINICVDTPFAHTSWILSRTIQSTTSS